MFIQSYAPQSNAIFKIYQQAKSGQWDPDTAINWRQEHVYEEFVNPEVGRLFNLIFVSQMFHGEQAALDICGGLIREMPDMESKLCLSVQVVDESRHVEVFGRYCRDIGDVAPMNEHLHALIDDLERAETILEQIIGMQVFIEGIALGAFKTKLKQTSDPLLKDILRLVSRDEARHAEFGMYYLQEHLNEGSVGLKDHLEKKIGQWWRLYEQSLRYRDTELWPTVPKLARRLFNRQTSNNLRDAKADLQLRLTRLGLQFAPK